MVSLGGRERTTSLLLPLNALFPTISKGKERERKTMDGWFRLRERARKRWNFPFTARDRHCFNSRLSALIPFYEIAFLPRDPLRANSFWIRAQFWLISVWQFDRLCRRRRRRHCAFVNGECGFAMDPFNGPINHRNISTHFQNNRSGESRRRREKINRF